MIGTLFSLLVAALLYFNPLTKEVIIHSNYLAVTMFIIATLFIVTQTAITLFAWSPLQKTEQNLTPRATESFKHDRNLRVTNFFLLVFLFFTYAAVIDILFLEQLNKKYLLVIWTILLGISVDFLHHHLKRVMDFLDPFQLVEMFGKSAQECLVGAKEAELCGWIDTLSETAVKAILKNSMSLSLLALDKLRLITKNYLSVAKGITYHADEEAGKFGGADHVSYTLFYLFQRMELIFDKALQTKFEPICSKIVTTLGKICIYGAKYDITLASYPLLFMRKFTAKAQDAGMDEVGKRATLTLLEVSKVIVKEIDLQYLEIKDAFISVIDNLHEIAKTSFKRDKSTNIRFLMQPFYDLRELFLSDKLANHQDSPSIVSNIDIVLNEFAALENVMSTMPPIPEIIKERESQASETETKPPEERPLP